MISPACAKFRFIGEFSFFNVGALIERPRGFAKQNRIAARRLLIISFGNPNHCLAMIGRAINDRPYEQNCRLFDKSEFSFGRFRSQLTIPLDRLMAQ